MNQAAPWSVTPIGVQVGCTLLEGVWRDAAPELPWRPRYTQGRA
jgi:hypothetical protein